MFLKLVLPQRESFSRAFRAAAEDGKVHKARKPMQSPAPLTQEDPGSAASGFAGPSKTGRPASRIRVGLMDVAGAFRKAEDDSVPFQRWVSGKQIQARWHRAVQGLGLSISQAVRGLQVPLPVAQLRRAEEVARVPAFKLAVLQCWTWCVS